MRQPMRTIKDKELFIFCFSEVHSLEKSIGIRDDTQDPYWVFIPTIYLNNPEGKRYSIHCSLLVTKLKRR